MNHLTRVLALGVAACGPTRIAPVEPSISHSEGAVVVGAPVEVSGSWSATCDRAGIAADRTEAVSCDEKPIRLEVSCDGSCAFDGGSGVREAPAFATIDVIPTAVGALTIHVLLRRTDSDGERGKTFTVQVQPPQRLALRCATADTNMEPCGPEGVPAASPVIEPIVYLDDRPTYSTFLRINGKPYARGTKVTLADLYPDASAGTGVKPGTYDVTVELAGMVEHYQVVAR
jgi:hypothetical protein